MEGQAAGGGASAYSARRQHSQRRQQQPHRQYRRPDFQQQSPPFGDGEDNDEQTHHCAQHQQGGYHVSEHSGLPAGTPKSQYAHPGQGQATMGSETAAYSDERNRIYSDADMKSIDTEAYLERGLSNASSYTYADNSVETAVSREKYRKPSINIMDAHSHSRNRQASPTSKESVPMRPMGSQQSDASDACMIVDKSGKTMMLSSINNGNTTIEGTGTDRTTLLSMLRGMGTRHQIIYLVIVLLQAIASLVLILIVWLKIRANTPAELKIPGAIDEGAVKRRSLNVYLVIFAFGAGFEVITALDALRLNNTIQLIGVSLFSLAMVAYAALLSGQIENAVARTTEDPWPVGLYMSVRPLLLAMPIIQAVTWIFLTYATWLLFKDFGWEVLHLIGADRKLKRMYTKYQIFISILKFDFFFFIGFGLQYMILVLSEQEVEYIVTLATFPITIIMLILAVVAVRREVKWLTWIVMISEFAALGYFAFKLFRLFQPSQLFRYRYTQKTLAVFSALATIMLLITIWNTIACYRRYGEGLKNVLPGYWGEHKTSRRQLARKRSNAAEGMLDTRDGRMSID